MAQWIMPIFQGLLNISESATFVQFIEEEAIQTCGMGAFLAIRAKNWKALSWCIQTLSSELIPHLKTINEIAGWLAPYSKGAFRDYVLASEVMVQVYEELLNNAALKSRGI